eukprot:6187381-Pleurochrysis_carterae.AAC.4
MMIDHTGMRAVTTLFPLGQTLRAPHRRRQPFAQQAGVGALPLLCPAGERAAARTLASPDESTAPCSHSNTLRRRESPCRKGRPSRVPLDPLVVGSAATRIKH